MKHLQFILFLLTATLANAQQTGCVSGDCKNGIGKFVYAPDKTSGLQCSYTGGFKDGKLNGNGEKVWVYLDGGTANQPKFSGIQIGVFDTNLIEGKNIRFENGDNQDTLFVVTGVFKNTYLSSGSVKKFIGGSKNGHYIKKTGTFGENEKYTTILHGWNGGTDIQFESTVFKKGSLCLSGDCNEGEGVLLYCYDDVYNSTVTIFKGTFKKNHFTKNGGYFKNGTMEIFNSNKVYENGFYEIDKFKLINKNDVNRTYSPTRFHPAGSDEILEGFLLAYDLEPDVSNLTPPHIQFRDFNYQNGLLYSDGSHLRTVGDLKYRYKPSKWLSTVYAPPFNAEIDAILTNSHQARLQQAEDDIDLLKTNPSAYYSKYPDRSPSSSSPSNTNTSGSNTYSSFSKCNVCNGYGYTEYDCGQGGGHPCRKSCTACSGTGQVHN